MHFHEGSVVFFPAPHHFIAFHFFHPFAPIRTHSHPRSGRIFFCFAKKMERMEKKSEWIDVDAAKKNSKDFFTTLSSCFEPFPFAPQSGLFFLFKKTTASFFFDKKNDQEGSALQCKGGW